MQEAIPFRTYIPATVTGGGGGNRQLSEVNRLVTGNGHGKSCVRNLVLENSVIVFGKRGCCMCHVVERLLQGLGVNPTVYEVDEKEETAVIDELTAVDGGKSSEIGEMQFPVVFVGGKKFGGLERVMATHISGELVPILKAAGALWL